MREHIRGVLRVATFVATLVGAAAFCTAGSATAQTMTLADAVDAALRGHPAVAAATARMSAAEEAGDAARAAWLPGAAVSATLTRFQEPMIVAPLHGLDLSSPPTFDRTLVQGRLGLQYTLFDGGARSARIRGADAAHEASGYARDATAMDILEQTVAAYVGVLSARAVLEASEAQVVALQAEHERAERALATGTTAEVEVLRAAATLQEARAEEASASARVGLADRALARLIGTDADDVSERALADVGTRATPPDGAAATSPLVLRASRTVAAAEARLVEERGGRLPSLEAGAGLLDYGTISGDHVLEWQAGLQMSWPLFTGGARSAAVRRAAAEVAAAERDLEATRLYVDQTADAARTAVVEADARAEALALAVTQWEEVARIEALTLAAGSGVQHDLLRAEAGLFGARAGHAAARYEAIVAGARLARAQGTLDRTWITEALETR